MKAIEIDKKMLKSPRYLSALKSRKKKNTLTAIIKLKVIKARLAGCRLPIRV
jgi:hypothetical protein